MMRAASRAEKAEKRMRFLKRTPLKRNHVEEKLRCRKAPLKKTSL
jgi:hypothetical protein